MKRMKGMMNSNLQKRIRNKKNIDKWKEGRDRNRSEDTDIMFLDIIHRPVYISIHNVSETGFCLRFQVKPTQLGPIDNVSPYLRTPIPAPR
jgi:hypothetical protein